MAARWVKLLGTAICLLALSGCGLEPTATRELQGDHPPPIGNEAGTFVGRPVTSTRTHVPAYLYAVAPGDGSALSLRAFGDGERVEEGLVVGKQEICAKLDPRWLISDGEFKGCEQLIIERVRLCVDDQDLGDPEYIDSYAVEMQILDEDGNVVAETNGPCVACWRAELGSDLHNARIEAQTRYGVEAYQWGFRLVEN
jgi:hypothetical protein